MRAFRNDTIIGSVLPLTQWPERNSLICAWFSVPAYSYSAERSLYGCVANPARGSDRLGPCPNHARPYSNGGTSNRRSFFVQSAGICDILSPIVTSRNF